MKQTNEIIAAVCRSLGYSLEAFREQDRRQHIADARHILVVSLMDCAGLGLAETGRAIGRHHTTILSSRRAFAALFDSCPEFRAMAAQAFEAAYEVLIRNQNNTMSKDNGFETWALVELYGHNRIAGKVTEQVFGNTSMIRIDVPKTESLPAWTKIVGIGAIYAINPMAEDDAIRMASSIGAKPITVFDMQAMFRERVDELIQQGRLLKPGEESSYDEDEEDDDDGPEF